MAYNDGIIYVDTSTDPDTGVGISDLRKAVPVTLTRTVEGVTEKRSSCDLGVLAAAKVGDSVPDSDGGAAWTVTSRIDINPMAKHKPVRHSKVAPLTDSEFKTVVYGLVAGSAFNASDPNPDNTWTYNRPRGKQGSVFEPFRITDFNGYDHLACPPFAFDVSGELANSVGLTFFLDSMAKEIYTGKRWTEENGIKFSDLLEVQSRYLCVAIHDLDATGSCVVILNKLVSSIGQYGYTVVLYAEQHIDSGITYPAVSILNDRSRDGHTFRFIVGMRNNNDGQPSTQAYKVLETTAVSGLISLALTQGIDRKDVQLYLLDNIDKLEFSLSSTTLAFTYIETVTRNGNMRWKKYKLTGRVYGEFVTPPGTWAVQTVSVEVRLRADAGYVNPIDNGTTLTGQDNVWSKGNIDVSLGNHTYSNVEIAFMSEVPIYIYIDATASVLVAAKVKYLNETKDAENTLIVSL